jgi:hypothetical protein
MCKAAACSIRDQRTALAGAVLRNNHRVIAPT